MRIRDVRAIPLESGLPQPVFDANHIMATKPALPVEVETGQGSSGLGEAAHFDGPLEFTRNVIEGELRDHGMGGDPRRIEGLWERMHQRAYKHARGGLLLGAVGNGSMAEMVFPVHPLMAGLVKEPLVVDRSGHIEISDRPGLGRELDPQVVAWYRVNR